MIVKREEVGHHFLGEAGVEPYSVQRLPFPPKDLAHVFFVHSLHEQPLCSYHSSHIVLEQLGHARELHQVKEIPFWDISEDSIDESVL